MGGEKGSFLPIPKGRGPYPPGGAIHSFFALDFAKYYAGS